MQALFTGPVGGWMTRDLRYFTNGRVLNHPHLMCAGQRRAGRSLGQEESDTLWCSGVGRGGGLQSS